MRLNNTTTLELESFPGLVPRYAILSHTWGVDEATLQDWQEAHKAQYLTKLYSTLCLPTPHSRIPPTLDEEDNPPCPPTLAQAATWPRASLNAPPPSSFPLGLTKILYAALRARADDLLYLWADTVCIDKTSSAELSEAINSMYAWYRNSSVCYAYLSDVNPSSSSLTTPDRLSSLSSPSSPFRTSNWFKRGWTLQELLAPKDLIFFASDWTELGPGKQKQHENDEEGGGGGGLVGLVSEITGIDREYLLGTAHIRGASVAHRLSWVADRTTTRPEDIAYCLLGIFDVHMPLIYGEGSRAFVRLQEEILKVSEDRSIFAWSWVAELSGPLMRGYRRDTDWAERVARREVPTEEVARRRKKGFPQHRLAALMANTLWRDPVRSTLLAPDPICFWDSGGFGRFMGLRRLFGMGRFAGLEREAKPAVMSNKGLTLELPLIQHVEGELVFAVLHEEEVVGRRGAGSGSESEIVCVPLVRHHEMSERYARTWFPPGPFRILTDDPWKIRAKEISVVRDVQHVRFYYPGFGGTAMRWGFWLMMGVREQRLRRTWKLTGGYVTKHGVFDGYGVFFDIPEEDSDGPVGGLLVFHAPDGRTQNVVIVFLAVNLTPSTTSGDKHSVEVSHHCEVLLRQKTRALLQHSTLEALYRTLVRKYRGVTSNRTACVGDTRLWIRNDGPFSHARDARIAMADITFGGDVT